MSQFRLVLLLTSLLCALPIAPSAIQPQTVATANAEPATPPASQIFLPLASGQAIVPSSDELIDAALERGEIDTETAILYRVFASYADARLPERFRGSTSDAMDSHGSEQAAVAWDTLSEKVRTQLQPFFIPPAYANSWANGAKTGQRSVQPRQDSFCGAQIERWRSIDGTSGRVRVWWEAARTNDAATAQAIVTEFDTAIWPKLRTLMGRDTISDQGELCNGGDGKLDIYLVDLGGGNKVKGFNVTYPPTCGTEPTYLQINRDLPQNQLRSTVAHEVMHAFQWAFPTQPVCEREDYRWWMEATATWAMHYVYPSDDLEHSYAPYMLEVPETSLEALASTQNRNHAYGAYVFAFYLQNKYAASFIRQSWEEMASADSLGALNKLLPKGLSEEWREFVLFNWNSQPAPYDSYSQPSWDSLKQRAALNLDMAVAMNGASNAYQKLEPAALDHLSARYYRFTFPDDTARGITFYNGLTYQLSDNAQGQPGMLSSTPIDEAQKQGASVQALIKIAGQWRKEDWTNTPITFFCRDQQSERIEELVIVQSNGQWQDRERVLEPADQPSILAASNIGCFRWKGISTVTETTQHRFTADNSQQSITADIVWERAPKLEPIPGTPFSNGNAYSFIPNGTLSFKHDAETYSDGVIDCVEKADQTLPITTVVTPQWIENNFLFFLASNIIHGSGSRAYDISGVLQKQGQITIDCFALPQQTKQVDLQFLDGDGINIVSIDGQTITKQLTFNCSDEFIQCEIVRTWKFTAERE